MHAIADNWLLVNVVDNNYVHSQLADLFFAESSRVGVSGIANTVGVRALH